MNARTPLPGAAFQDRLYQAALTLDQRLYVKKVWPDRSWDWPAELLFNLLGLFVGFVFIRLPHAEPANRVTIAIARYKSGRPAPPLSAGSLENAALVRKLAAQLTLKHGRAPRMLMLMSHPETVGEEARLLGDLVEHATNVCQSFPEPVKLALVQAIDPFALDLLPMPKRESYVGLMAAGHLAMDRFPNHATLLRRVLFHGLDFDEAVFRIFDALAKGRAVCMAPAGAVEHNARVFYTVREFSDRLLRAARKKYWSKQELRLALLDVFTHPQSTACLKGELSPIEASLIEALAQTGEVPAAETRKLLEELRSELRFPTPYRFRFFNALFRRICARNQPLLLVFLTHCRGNCVEVAPPVAVTGYDARAKTVAFVSADGKESKKDEAAFVRSLVESQLNP